MLSTCLLGIAAGLSPSPHTLYSLSIYKNTGLKRQLGVSIFGGLLADTVIVCTLIYLANSLNIQRFIPWINTLAALNLIRMSIILLRNSHASKYLMVMDTPQLRVFTNSFGIQIFNPNIYLFWSSIGLSNFLILAQKNNLNAGIFFVMQFLITVYGVKFIIVSGLGTLLQEKASDWLNKGCAIFFTGLACAYLFRVV